MNPNINDCIITIKEID